MPRKAPATGETSGAERYQSPGIGAAPRPTRRANTRCLARPTPAPALPAITLENQQVRASGCLPYPLETHGREILHRAPPLAHRGGRTPAPAAEPRHAGSDRGSDCPSLPAPPSSTTPGVGATVTRWSRVSVLGSLSSAFGERHPAARASPGPIEAEGTESRTRARPAGGQAHPPCRDGVVARQDFDLEAVRSRPGQARGHRPPARWSLPPSPAPGLTERLSAMSLRATRENSRTEARRSSSGGRSPASSISPSVTTTTGTLRGRGGGQRRAEQRAPAARDRVGAATSSPKSRISPSLPAESRASRHRPPGAPMLSEPSRSTSGRKGARRRRAADVEEQETERGPCDSAAGERHESRGGRGARAGGR